jgi:hypothetical protein
MGKPQGYVLVYRNSLAGKATYPRMLVGIYNYHYTVADAYFLYINSKFLYINSKAFPVLYLFGKDVSPSSLVFSFIDTRCAKFGDLGI